MAINKVFLAGNLTRNPELRATKTGTPVLSFGIAVNDRARNQQTGEWEDRPNFFECTMFGSRAEKLAQYLSIGSKVSIEGRLHWSQWERDGQKSSKVEVVVTEIEFLSAKSDAGVPYSQTAASVSEPADPAPASIYDQDIRF